VLFAMAQGAKYELIQVGETLDVDLEKAGSGSAANYGRAVTAHGGMTKYVSIVAMLLLAGAAAIYSVTSSPPKVTQAYPSDNEAVVNQFYEVAQDTDSTAPPGVTVAGQLRIQVSDPSQFANDPAALQAVKQSIAKIAGVPASAVKDVKMFPVVGASGVVQADFKIDVPAENADQVVDGGAAEEHGEGEHGPRVLKTGDLDAEQGHVDVLVAAAPHVEHHEDERRPHEKHAHEVADEGLDEPAEEEEHGEVGAAAAEDGVGADRERVLLVAVAHAAHDPELERERHAELAEKDEAGDEAPQVELVDDEAPALPPDVKCFCGVAEQTIAKFKEATSNRVRIHICAVRLLAQETDILVTLNYPVSIDPQSSSAGAPLVQGAEELFARVMKSFKIIDWNLFDAP